MAYRFRKNEAIPRAIERVFAEEISGAVGHLIRSKKRVDAIHEARKSIKKVRGLLSLLGSAYKKQDHYFRDAGKLLSDVRDNAVMLQVFDGLAKKHPELDASTTKEIRNTLSRASRTAPEEKQVSAQAAAVLQQAGRLCLQDMPFDSLMQEVEKTYFRGRKALKKARKEQTAESYHDFRKQVKQHWYHLRLLEEDLAPKHLGQLHDLETALGDEHNLTVLRNCLKAETETSKDREQIKHVMAWIESDSDALRKLALDLGEKLYAHKEMRLPKPVSMSTPSKANSVVA